MTTQALADEIRRIVQSFANEETDRYGFTSLDVLLAELADQGSTAFPSLISALRNLLHEWANGNEKHWQAFRDLVLHLKLRSAELAAELEKVLDTQMASASPMARYYALQALFALGGQFTGKQLLAERELRSKLPSLWLDLATRIYQHAPERLCQFFCEELRQQRISWVDVRRRIPTLYQTFGQEFVSLMKEIVLSVPSEEAQDDLVKAVDSYYDFGMTQWLRHHRKHFSPGSTQFIVADFEGPRPSDVHDVYRNEGFDRFVEQAIQKRELSEV